MCTAKFSLTFYGLNYAEQLHCNRCWIQQNVLDHQNSKEQHCADESLFFQQTIISSVVISDKNLEDIH